VGGPGPSLAMPLGRSDTFKIGRSRGPHRQARKDDQQLESSRSGIGVVNSPENEKKVVIKFSYTILHK